MANQHHVYCYGDIFNEQSEYASDWGVVSLTSIRNQIQQAPTNTDEIILHIHSGGGDVFEGFAIHDYLRGLGKKIITRAEGLCASIATIVMLAGDERNMTKNSTFMIHNPVMGFAMGDADDLEAQAELLRQIEDRIINFYHDKTGQEKTVLDEWMKEEKFMTPEQAKELGFITDIIEDLKIAAYYPLKRKTQKDTNMENIFKPLSDKLDSILNKLGVTQKTEVTNDLRLSTADGKVLIITTDKDQANVDDKIRIEDGNIPDGEYVMPDGDVIVVANSIITEIRTKTGEQVDENTQNDVILQLQNEVQTLRSENQELRNQINPLTEKLTLLLDNIESGFNPPARGASFVKKEKTTEVSDSKPNFDEALNRIKERETKSTK